MKRIKELERLLDLIIEFGNEESITRCRRLLDKINLLAFELDFIVEYEDRKKDESISAMADYVLAAMLVFEEGRVGTQRFRSSLLPYIGKEGDPPRFVMIFESPEEDMEGLVNLMAHLMFFLGINEVRKCPGCENYFLIKNNPRKKVCSPKCRQRVFQKNRPEEERQKYRMRRSELYYQKKRGER